MKEVSAQRLLSTLKNEVDGIVSFNYKNEHKHIPGKDFESLAGDMRAGIEAAIFENASSNFQYYYRNYPIFEFSEAGVELLPALNELMTFLNSEDFLKFARKITGFQDIRFCDAQATAFGPGHFLTNHSDAHATKNRRAAYIINLSENWNENWGGHLALFDENGHIKRAIKPVFNSMNIIAVPQPHSVTYVTPFANQRYSITGWLRAA